MNAAISAAASSSPMRSSFPYLSSVITMDACPAITWTRFGFLIAAAQIEMQECRASCNVQFSSPAAVYAAAERRIAER